MEKELIHKVLNKKFIELSPTEREEMKQWCASEEEFDQLKFVFSNLSKLKENELLTPRPETKRSLDELFAQKHAKKAPVVWYNSMLVLLYPKEKPFALRPIIQLAAIALVLLMVYPFLFNEPLKRKDQPLAKNEQPINQPKSDITTQNSVESPKVTSGSQLGESSDHVKELEVESMIVDAESFGVEDLALDENPSLSSMAGASAFAESTHPDGIFVGVSTITYSQPVSAQPDVLDLLTTTF